MLKAKRLSKKNLIGFYNPLIEKECVFNREILSGHIKRIGMLINPNIILS